MLTGKTLATFYARLIMINNTYLIVLITISLFPVLMVQQHVHYSWKAFSKTTNCKLWKPILKHTL